MPKRKAYLTLERVKKVMLDCVEVNTNCPESVQKYGERCEMVEELYDGYKNYIKIVGERDAKAHEDRKKSSYEVDQHTMGDIERLLTYKDEYIG